MYPLRRLVGLVLALLMATSLLWSSEASAGGFTIPLIGGRASTKMAFVAKPDDTSAVYHNPAGLSLLGPYQIDLSGTGILSYSAYSRCSVASPIGCATDASGNIRYEPTIETTKHGAYPRGFGILPYFGMSGRFGLKRWNFGLAVYSPHNATGSFPDCERGPNGEPVDCSMAPQRFHAQLGTINTIYINPSASFEPHPGIAIGAGVSAVRAAITLDRSLWLGGESSMVGGLYPDWKGEGRIHLEANAWSAAFSFGVIWNVGETFKNAPRILKGLRFGFSYQSQTKFKFTDKMSLYSEALQELLVTSDNCQRGNVDRQEVRCTAEAKFTFPRLVRFGFNWQFTKEWDVGFDVFWQQYSVYKEIKISFPEPINLGGIAEVSETAEPKNSVDSWSFALGAQYAPLWAKGLEIRAGVIFDESPYPNSTYTLLSPDADKLGFSLGLSYRFKFGLELGAGYIILRYFDRIVRDSKIVPKLCELGDTSCESTLPPAPFSMNGDVKNKIVHLFAMHVGWRFGGGKPPLESPKKTVVVNVPPPPPSGDPRATPARTQPAPPPPAPPRAKPPRRQANPAAKTPEAPKTPGAPGAPVTPMTPAAPRPDAPKSR